jgi:hypothetical protein
MAFGYIYYDGRHVHVRWPRGRTSNLAKVESVMNAVSMRSVHVKIKPLAPPGETASEKTLVPGKNSGRLADHLPPVARHVVEGDHLTGARVDGHQPTNKVGEP